MPPEQTPAVVTADAGDDYGGVFFVHLWVCGFGSRGGSEPFLFCGPWGFWRFFLFSLLSPWGVRWGLIILCGRRFIGILVNYVVSRVIVNALTGERVVGLLRVGEVYGLFKVGCPVVRKKVM